MTDLDDYIDINPDNQVIRIEDEIYSFQENHEGDALILVMEESKYCEGCEQIVIDNGNICEHCGMDERKPTMGGYDPELDEG